MTIFTISVPIGCRNFHIPKAHIAQTTIATSKSIANVGKLEDRQIQAMIAAAAVQKNANSALNRLGPNSSDVFVVIIFLR